LGVEPFTKQSVGFAFAFCIRPLIGGGGWSFVFVLSVLDVCVCVVISCNSMPCHAVIYLWYSGMISSFSCSTTHKNKTNVNIVLGTKWKKGILLLQYIFCTWYYVYIWIDEGLLLSFSFPCVCWCGIIRYYCVLVFTFDSKNKRKICLCVFVSTKIELTLSMQFYFLVGDTI